MKRSYLMLLGAIILYSLVSVLSKAAALQDFLTLPFLALYGAALALMAVYAVIWQLCLERVPLVAAYAMRGILFVLIGIWSYLFFRETLTIVQWIGMLVIIAGVFVSQSGAIGGDKAPDLIANTNDSTAMPATSAQTANTIMPAERDDSNVTGGTNV